VRSLLVFVLALAGFLAPPLLFTFLTACCGDGPDGESFLFLSVLVGVVLCALALIVLL